MEKVQRSQAFLRKRKMMVVLPLLVIPFLTMGFWAMGGGKGAGNEKKIAEKQGLNLQLPNPKLKEDNSLNKLSFYDQADKDSLKLAELIRNDPYYWNQDSMQREYSKQLEKITESSAAKFNQPYLNSGLKTTPYNIEKDPAEQNVLVKIAELNKAINQPQNDLRKETITSVHDQDSDNQHLGSDVDRLENMMQIINNCGDDSEMKDLNHTLEKILDIQHPERVKERIKEKSLLNRIVVYPISKIAKKENVSLLDRENEKQSVPGFFGLEDESTLAEENNSIEAVVHENQTLVNGGVVKLRLLNDVYINGSFIAKGTFVFGMATLNEERLKIEINSIRYNQSLYPVKLEVYDIDGLPGIYIPGATTRDVAKQSADNSLQLMELTSLDPSLKAQATAAGISAAKNLLSRKIKQVKVMVKAGYKVLLKDKNTE